MAKTKTKTKIPHFHVWQKYPIHMKPWTKRLYRTLIKIGYIQAAVQLVPAEDLNKKWFFSDHEVFRRGPSTASTESIQRSILELAALKMDKEDRQSLFLPEDELYVRMRRPHKSSYYQAIRQQWYKRTEKGQRRMVSSLYKTIQRDPQAFLQMLA